MKQARSYRPVSPQADDTFRIPAPGKQAFVDRRPAQATQRKLAALAGERGTSQLPSLPVRSTQGGNGAPMQRVKGKPSDDELRAAVAKSISNELGSCRNQTVEVYHILRKFADDASETGAELLMWIEDGGEDVGNHMAATIQWSEGTFVVDTTAGQFGGPEVFIGSRSDWQTMILGLQGGHEVTHPVREALAKPISDIDMAYRAYEYGKPFRKPEPEEEKIAMSEEEPKAKPKKGKGGKSPGKTKRKCFLTTACVEHRGLPDDCRELETLRAFRDGYLRAQPEGPALIEDYYRLAPALVASIQGAADAASVLDSIYSEVALCVADIDDGDPASALARYRTMVERLLARFPAQRTDGEKRRLRTS